MQRTPAHQGPSVRIQASSFAPMRGALPGARHGQGPENPNVHPRPAAPPPRSYILVKSSRSMEKTTPQPETAAERRKRAQKIFDEAFPKGIAIVSVRMGKPDDS